MCCISMNSSGFFLSFFLQLVNRTAELLLECLYFLLFSTFQKWHNWLGEICLYSGERILGYRNGQDTFSNMFCFQVLWKILGNAKWVTVAGVVKDLESRNMYHLQYRILNRKPNRLPRMRKSLGCCILFSFFAVRLQSGPSDFTWRSLAWWYFVGKAKCP